MKAAVTLRESQLEALFRAFLKVDRDLVVLSVGPFFAKRDSLVVPGERLYDLFSLGSDRDDDLFSLSSDRAGEGPSALEVAIPAMADTPERLELFCRTKNIRLAGIVFSNDEGFLLALNIVPEDFIIEGQGLHITDFSQIDASVPALTLIGMQRALLAEARAGAIDLANAQSQAMELLDRTQRIGRYIVHDLTNYLSIIRLNVANLARSGGANGSADASRAAIEAATRHVSDLALSLERLTGHRDVEAHPIALDQTIRSNLAFLAASLPSDFTLDFIGSVPDAAVRVGRTELITMLTNVIVHAHGAMAEGGSITISTYRCEVGPELTSEPAPQQGTGAKPVVQPIPGAEWIVIKIIDDGPGMDEETVRMMLDPHSTVKADGPEIPLRSVRTWARGAGGDVWITAMRGAGTEIRIHLPVSGDAGRAEHVPVAAPDDQVAPRPGNSARVLVVEDEIHALDAVVEILRMEGYTATPASNAAQAIEALASGEFDILLTDVIMPERSGVELAREVEERHPRIGIILMSGYFPDESTLQPHWRMLRKPLDLSLLSKALEATHASLSQVVIL